MIIKYTKFYRELVAYPKELNRETKRWRQLGYEGRIKIYVNKDSTTVLGSCPVDCDIWSGRHWGNDYKVIYRDIKQPDPLNTMPRQYRKNETEIRNALP